MRLIQMAFPTEMDETTIERFWETHPCGDWRVGGLDRRYRGDYEKGGCYARRSLNYLVTIAAVRRAALLAAYPFVPEFVAGCCLRTCRMLSGKD
jgi:hypothetical protein